MGAAFAPTRFSLIRISIRDLVADGNSLVRNSGVGGRGQNLISLLGIIFDRKFAWVARSSSIGLWGLWSPGLSKCLCASVHKGWFVISHAHYLHLTLTKNAPQEIFSAILDGRNRARVFAESLARVITAIQITSVRWRSYLPLKTQNLVVDPAFVALRFESRDWRSLV